MTDRRPFYITTPIYYINSVPHIGHSYTTIAADVMARYHRLLGDEVFFLTGTDEHGQKVARAAAAQGQGPQAWADAMSAEFRNLWPRLDITNDDFIRTTEPRHETRVQRAFRQLLDQGDIYRGEYEGWYCVPCETFWPENQLVEGGKCPDCGRAVERLKEPTYFFRMSKYVPWLLEHVAAHPDFVQPDIRRNEVVSRLKQGVYDLSVTRATLEWGVPAPVPEGHTIYVWIDALFNYITALGWPSDRFDRWWNAGAVHFIGKEILWFHGAIWPCILKALGLALPRTVFAHGWWVFGEDLKKISKSTGNVVDPMALAAKVGVDAVRYFLLRQTPFGADGQFSYQALVERTNMDLANDLGNLFHRTLTMIEKYFGGAAPPAGPPERDLAALADATADRFAKCMDNCQFSLALEAVWGLVRAANEYIEKSKPWVLAKDAAGRPRLGTVLYSLAEVCRLLSVYLTPFMPKSAEGMRERLGLAAALTGTFDDLVRWGRTVPGSKVARGAPLFPRVEIDDP
jgi:methionyl-tRNA synthetase